MEQSLLTRTLSVGKFQSTLLPNRNEFRSSQPCSHYPYLRQKFQNIFPNRGKESIFYIPENRKTAAATEKNVKRLFESF